MKALPLIAALTIAGCSGGEERDGGSTQTFDASEEASSDASSRAPAPPGITPTAAPGVAFNYNYAFRLPHDRIAAAQEQHASACEKLGVERCRITGFLYEARGDDDVDAQIAFKLDPALARRFGKEGIDAVTRAEGRLVRAQITGEDVGTRIAQGTRSRAEMQEELRRIEAQLAQRGLGAAERAQLQSQAQDLRARLRAEDGAQAERREQLATTPMVFNYRAGETDRSLRAALTRALDGFGQSARAVLIFFVYILPWALLALLLWLGWRWAKRRFLDIDRIAPPIAPAVTEE